MFFCLRKSAGCRKYFKPSNYSCSSQSEGLPVALLEYGLHKKPVVVTAVGDMPN
jgi:hypothetical protein